MVLEVNRHFIANIIVSFGRDDELRSKTFCIVVSTPNQAEVLQGSLSTLHCSEDKHIIF